MFSVLFKVLRCRLAATWLIGFAFLLSCFCTLPIHAQNETGTRTLNSFSPKAQYLWYKPSRARYQTSYPIIHSIPPLNSSMPFEVMLSYFLLDSVMRNTTLKQTTSMHKSWNSMNDTLKWAAQGMYLLADYNPILMHQYGIETLLHRKPSTPDTSIPVKKMKIGDSTIPNNIPTGTLPLFSNILPYFLNSLSDCMYTCGPDSAERNALYSLLYSDYILRVKINSIDSTIDYMGLSPQSKIYRAVAEVIDTIKGKVFKSYDYPIIKKGGNAQQTNNYPLIAFEYTRNHYSGTTSIHYTPYEYRNVDPAFTEEYSDFVMHPGQEAVVFIKLSLPLIDSSNDYFNVELNAGCSNNALPIINGEVRDLNHVWSQTTLQSYSAWKSRVQQLITKILTRSY